MIGIISLTILCEHHSCVSKFKKSLTFLLKDFVDATNYQPNKECIKMIIMKSWKNATILMPTKNLSEKITSIWAIHRIQITPIKEEFHHILACVIYDGMRSAAITEKMSFGCIIHCSRYAPLFPNIMHYEQIIHS